MTRTLKIVFGCLAFLWALRSLIRLPGALSLAGTAYGNGALAGLILALVTSVALSVVLLRSAFRKQAFDAKLLPMADWKLVGQKPMSAFWRDRVGDAVSLTRCSAGFVSENLSDERGLQSYCRRIAESQGAGLVEVEAATSAEGPCLKYIYKRLEKPAFKFFGVVAIPVAEATWIWMVVTGERGTTGVREAVVTAKLFEAGKLTLESYKTSWAQDPYDPSYAGVDKSTLRYISDSPEYDADFPDHPLTKMRRELRRLIEIRISPPAY
jgi:hypothetical protein